MIAKAERELRSAQSVGSGSYRARMKRVCRRLFSESEAAHSLYTFAEMQQSALQETVERAQRTIGQLNKAWLRSFEQWYEMKYAGRPAKPTDEEQVPKPYSDSFCDVDLCRHGLLGLAVRCDEDTGAGARTDGSKTCGSDAEAASSRHPTPPRRAQGRAWQNQTRTTGWCASTQTRRKRRR